MSTNLAYEVAVRGGILPNTDQFTPYMAGIDRYVSKVDYAMLKNGKVICVAFEAGYLYDAIHVKQSRYRNPNLASQVQSAIDNKMPYGLYADIRARNLTEAKSEIYELSLVIQRFRPQVGLWLRPLFNNSRSVNDSIIDLYYDKMVRIGLKNQLGFYCTRNQLNQISWNKYQNDWYLWLVSHISNFSNVEELLTPQFFMLEG